MISLSVLSLLSFFPLLNSLCFGCLCGGSIGRSTLRLAHVWDAPGDTQVLFFFFSSDFSVETHSFPGKLLVNDSCCQRNDPKPKWLMSIFFFFIEPFLIWKTKTKWQQPKQSFWLLTPPTCSTALLLLTHFRQLFLHQVPLLPVSLWFIPFLCSTLHMKPLHPPPYFSLNPCLFSFLSQTSLITPLQKPRGAPSPLFPSFLPSFAFRLFL